MKDVNDRQIRVHPVFTNAEETTMHLARLLSRGHWAVPANAIDCLYEMGRIELDTFNQFVNAAIAADMPIEGVRFKAYVNEGTPFNEDV